MTTYMVTWKMEFDANSPLEAAELAQDVQHDAQSLATCFEVYDVKTPEKVIHVDAALGLTAESADELAEKIEEAL